MKRRHAAKALAGVRPGTVLDHYTERYGVTKGAYRAAHFIQIAAVVREHGRDHSAREYAEFWGVDERTAFLHRAEAREVYGEGWRDVAVSLVEALDASHVTAPGRAARLSFSPS